MPCWMIILSSFVIVTNDVSNLILGCALEFNSSLKILNVAYNAFGDIGTQAIGRSLKFNKGRFCWLKKNPWKFSQKEETVW